MLARLGITATPLPCLTGLAGAMRYSTAGSVEIEALSVPRLGEQARDGLGMLRRLEACAQAWRSRLEGLTARSHKTTTKFSDRANDAYLPERYS